MFGHIEGRLSLESGLKVTICYVESYGGLILKNV